MLAGTLVPLAPLGPWVGDGAAAGWQGGGTMSSDQFYGIVRHVVSAAGGIVITMGTSNADTVNQLTGGVLALAAIVWSIFSKSRK